LLHKLSLVWGVRAFYVSSYNLIHEVYKESVQILKTNNLVEEGDYLVYVASLPLIKLGSTNMIKVSQV